ncbi:hypothetical protein DPX39_100017100 [Trypanosoma brucei equiperdum]|uniref:Uncharacterized protein n=1 Tax=Trypanosoma brucei equiperdum TaxID=630700 RepID=A0A3L6KYW2_9TRYP|nr:hypothetical protein DPX39_100017100 [Trypanosoma brucei equiperdum]
MAEERCLEGPMEYFFAALERQFPKQTALIGGAKSLTQAILRALDVLYPFVEALFVRFMDYAKSLSSHELNQILPLIAGFSICFFGGCFFTLFSTVEIVYLTSWDRIKKSAEVIHRNYVAAMEASRKDDAPGYGYTVTTGDESLSKNELLSRKLRIFLQSVDPVSVKEELAAVALAFMAVVAALRDRFAYYVTLGCIFADTAPRFFPLKAILEESLPPELQKLAGPFSNFLFGALGTTIAVLASQYTITLHCATRGSKMLVDSALELAKTRGIVVQDVKVDDSWVKAFAFGLAVIGFTWQAANGFSLPFPLNLLLFPVTVLEWIVNVIFRASGSAVWATTLSV